MCIMRAMKTTELHSSPAPRASLPGSVRGTYDSETLGRSGSATRAVGSGEVQPQQLPAGIEDVGRDVVQTAFGLRDLPARFHVWWFRVLPFGTVVVISSLSATWT